jgi:hypothetical protein
MHPLYAGSRLIGALVAAPLLLAITACDRQSTDSQGTYSADGIPKNQCISHGGGGSATMPLGPTEVVNVERTPRAPASTHQQPGGTADCTATGRP